MNRIRIECGVSLVAVMFAASAIACSDRARTITSPTARSSSARLSDSLPPVSSEWTLTPPAAVPANGCVSITDVSTASLDWVLTARPGHPSAFFIEPLAFHKEKADCTPTDDEKRDARRLSITGHSQFAALEEGSSTLSWSADRCKDGGRFEIDVLVERLESSESDSDKQSTQTIVNCGFDSPVSQQ